MNKYHSHDGSTTKEDLKHMRTADDVCFDYNEKEDDKHQIRCCMREESDRKEDWYLLKMTRSSKPYRLERVRCWRM